MTSEPLYLVAILCANVALSEWLVRHTPLRHLGSALLVIVLTAVAANVGILPPYTAGVPVYDGIFRYVAPLGIFWLLLEVRLGALARVGGPLLALFLLGAAGTVAGVLVGMFVVGGEAAFGESAFALGGMFVGTYVGGSINFNAIALEYGVVEDGALYAGAAVVDSAMTTLWMGVNVLVPRVFGRLWPKRGEAPTKAQDAITGEAEDTETVHPMDLAIVVGLGALGVVASDWLAAWIESKLGWRVPSMLVLTTIALILAHLPFAQRLRGARLAGMFAVYLFLAVIGALCDLEALRRIGDLGVDLSIFVVLVVGVHGLVVYVASMLLRIDPTIASVASQANVGGGTSALALARSLGRADLVLPSILIGTIGTALGTYLGFLTAAWLR